MIQLFEALKQPMWDNERRPRKVPPHHANGRGLDKGDTAPMPDSTLKLCECGCGQPAPIAKRTDSRHSYVKGQPVRFVCGHHGRRPLAERFWPKVDKTPGHGPWGDCHLWTGCTSAGYGDISLDGRMVLAHRVAWFLETGEWPDPCALHRCDNPSCVNPAHLFEGTHADNSADKVAKGRGDAPRGERNGSAKLTTSAVAEIRALYPGVTQRELASAYGVSQPAISRVLHHKQWALGAALAARQRG